MKVFLNFLKYFASMIVILCIGITCIAAFCTKDAFFIIAGVIASLAVIGGIVYYFIRKSKETAPVIDFLKRDVSQNTKDKKKK